MMRIETKWPFFVWCVWLACLMQVQGDNDIRWIEKILNETVLDYDKRIIPLQSDKPLELTLGLFLLNMGDMQSVHSHFSTELIMHSAWEDHRLKYPGNESASYRITGEAINMIWTPDVVIRSEKDGIQSAVTTRNMFAMIKPSGKIVTSQRYFVEHFCSMDFFFYPFDEQTCRIEVMSYAYSKEWLTVNWIVGNPVRAWEEVKLSAKFQLVAFETNKVVSDFHTFGKYDVLELIMKLRRRDMPSVLRVYIPLTVMVIMSWLCFLIDYRSVPARTSMNAALVLTVITFIASIQKDLPSSSTTRVVDIYMLVCFLYIFAGLVEYAVVRSTVIKSKMNNRRRMLEKSAVGHDAKHGKKAARKLSRIDEGELRDKKKKRLSITHKLYKMYLKNYDDYHILDRISMVLFPVTFTAYCICYFVYIKFSQ